MSDAPDLSLVTTDELVDELFRRHTASVILLEREAKVGDSRQTYLNFDGSVSNAIGLCERAKHDLLTGDFSVGGPNDQT